MSENTDTAQQEETYTPPPPDEMEKEIDYFELLKLKKWQTWLLIGLIAVLICYFGIHLVILIIGVIGWIFA